MSWKDEFSLLSEEQMAEMERSEIEEYYRFLVTEAARIKYGLTTPSSKFQRRLKAIQYGEDPNETAPIRNPVKKPLKKKKKEEE